MTITYESIIIIIFLISVNQGTLTNVAIIVSLLID